MDAANILCDVKKDRISELPINVIDCIFKRMPIRDAGRTIILSKSWRHIWPSYPHLAFDKNFIEEICQKRGGFIPLLEYIKVINHVLSVHRGPVLKFLFLILKLKNPISFPIDLSLEMDKWMLYLSKNGIKILEIDNPNTTPYIMPSCILLCSSLIELKLHNCILRPPHPFRGFHYLKKLVLIKVSFSASTSATLLHNALVLRELLIGYCTGIEQISIHAPELEHVSMVNNDKVDWQWLKRTKHLKFLQLHIDKEVNKVDQTINMIEFLKYIRKVERLYLDGLSLKYLAAGNPSGCLARPTLPCEPALYLKFLKLLYLSVHDLDQISCAFCLLKSSPKLTSLELLVAESTDDVPNHITEYLESPSCTDLSLDMLETVEILHFKGLKAELLLIKFLLVRSTNLQRMIIEKHASNDASNGIKIYEELLKFARASSRAEIQVIPKRRRSIKLLDCGRTWYY